MNRPYNIVKAEIINADLADNGSGGYAIVGKRCTPVDIEITTNYTNKSLQGSNEVQNKSIQFLAYRNIKCLLKFDTIIKIDGVAYGNLEVTDIVGTKLKVRVRGEC